MNFNLDPTLSRKWLINILKYTNFLNDDIEYLETIPTEILMNKLDCATNSTYRILCQDKLFWIYYARNRGYDSSLTKDINQVNNVQGFINVCKKYLIFRINEETYYPQALDSAVISADIVEFLGENLRK